MKKIKVLGWSELTNSEDFTEAKKEFVKHAGNPAFPFYADIINEKEDIEDTIVKFPNRAKFCMVFLDVEKD
jgi:hypothetical protein